VRGDAVEPVAPASELPAHASLVTGARPADHGVPADRPIGPRGVVAGDAGGADAIRVPALWDAARDRGLPVAVLDWPGSAGARVDWLLPPATPASGEPASAALARGATREALAMAERAGLLRSEAESPGPARDRALGDVACELLRAPRAPSLLLLRLSQTAPVLREVGRDAPATRRAFGAIDAEIERLVACLADVQRLSATTVVVTGAAGTLPVHTWLRPNAALRAQGLIQAGPGGTGVSGWTAIARSNGGSAFVYARDDDAALRARRALERLAEQTRAFDVVPASAMLELGADPAAWFGLEAHPGFLFADAADGPLLSAAARRAGSGYLPGTPAMQPGFVMFGAGVREGVRVPWMRQTDVAPTVARLLRIELPAAHGRPLVGALTGAAPRTVGEGSGGR